MSGLSKSGKRVLLIPQQQQEQDSNEGANSQPPQNIQQLPQGQLAQPQANHFPQAQMQQSPTGPIPSSVTPGPHPVISTSMPNPALQPSTMTAEPVQQVMTTMPRQPTSNIPPALNGAASSVVTSNPGSAALLAQPATSFSKTAPASKNSKPGLLPNRTNSSSFLLPQSSASPNAGLNVVLVDYVLHQGFTNTANALIKEIDQGNSLKRPRHHSPQLDTLIQGYELFRNWLINSLDEFRDELWPVLWVVFVHSYLSLVKAGNSEFAFFRDKFKEDHEHNHNDDIKELATITLPELIKESKLAKRVLKNRFQLRMRTYPCELLMSFFMEHDLLPIMNIVNNTIDIQIGEIKQSISCFGRRATGILEMDAAATVLSGLEASTLSRLKSKPVKWFVNKKLRSLISGATGAQASAQSLPQAPNESNKEPEQPAPSLITQDQATSHKFEHGGRIVQILNRITKLDRYNINKASQTMKTVTFKPKEKKKTKSNHTAPKDAHFDSPDKYNDDIEEFLIGPLQLASLDPEHLVSGTLSEHVKQRAKEISQSVGFQENAPLPLKDKIEWPSIALQTFFNAHDSLICVDSSSEGTLFAAGFDDSVCRVWYYPSEKNEHSTVKPNSSEPTTSANGEPSSSANNDEKYRNVTSTEPICEELFGHSGPVYACSISPDAQSILSASEDGTVRLWMRFPELGAEDRSTKPANEVTAFSESTSAEKQDKKQHKKKLSQSQHFRQGSWRNVFAFRPRPSQVCPVWDVKFSPVGYYFVSGGYDGTARLWCVDRAEPLRIFHGHISDVNCISWHPNCRYVATGSTDKTVRVWEVTTGECCRLFTGHTGGVSCLAWASSGRYLVSGGQDRTAIVWDFAAGERLMVLQDHMSPINCVTVSPSYDFIATGCADGSVRLFDADRIWGKSSVAHYLAVHNLDPHSEKLNEPIGTDKKKSSHVPKSLHEPPLHRTFPTKYTPIHSLQFLNERLILAAGGFALPVMK